MKKTIIVIGAGKGLGNAVAEKFGSNDFRVILMSRSEDHLKKYEQEFLDKGIEVYTHIADVSNLEQFSQDFKEVIEKYGSPDVVFYNVGVTTADSDCEINGDTLIKRYIVDVVGAYSIINLVATEDFAKKNGAVLITGGGFALTPYAGYLPLSMDKAALRAMVQALAPVLKEKGIYLGTVQITGVIGSNEHFAPKTISNEFWKLYTERDKNEIIY